MDQVSIRDLELEMDIDGRMLDIWRQALDIESWNLETAVAFMRAAYGKGYCDALSEHPDDRGELTRSHGFPMPLPNPLPIDRER